MESVIYAETDVSRAIKGVPEAVWACGKFPEGTPAAVYVRTRIAWPPHGGSFPALPLSIRWFPREKMPFRRIPSEALGAIGYRLAALGRSAADVAFRVAFGFGRGGDRTAAVQFEALRDGGQRLAPRWRQCQGNRVGTVFEADLLLTGPPEAVRLMEGEVGAITAALLHPSELVRATGGTVGLTRAGLAGLPDTLPVVIEGEGDLAGRAARARLERGLQTTGRAVRPEWRGGTDGTDAADGLR